MREEINSDTELYLACKKHKKNMIRKNINKRAIITKRLKRIKKKKKNFKTRIFQRL